jgi:hypothetical protein
MNVKIIGIFVCMLLIATVLPTVGEPIQTGDMKNSNFTQSLIQTAASGYTPSAPPSTLLAIPKVHDHPEKTVATLNDGVISMLEQVDETIVLRYLENITSFGPRVMGTEACKKSASYIYNAFQSLGLMVRYDNFDLPGTENNGTNIEATLEGVDTSSDEIYIMCGHYDSVPGSKGADDNAISIAAMLSIAQIMKQYSFNHTIRFIAFDAEEGGLLGSSHYVQSVYENRDNLIAVLNADMIGNTGSEEGKKTVTIYSDYQSRWYFEYASEISQTYFDYIHLKINDGGISGGSDHMPFWSNGYTAIYFEEFDFSPNWHKTSDTIANVNIAYATNVSKLILATAAESIEIHENTPPNTPVSLVGPTQGKPGIEYSYSSSTIDPDGDQVYYWFDWGDGNTSGWLGVYNSGSECIANHTWDAKGNYTIRVKVKDIHNTESDWTTLSVTMPNAYNKPIHQILELLFQRFPHVFLLLRYLLM